MISVIRKVASCERKKGIFCTSLLLILIYCFIHGCRHILNTSQKKLNWSKLPIVPPICKNRIIIVSHQRSGSSFFGDLMQQSWPTYYLYEPLYFLGETKYIDQVQNEEKIKMTLDTLVELYNCKSLNQTRYKKKIFWALHWTKVMNDFKTQKGKLANTQQVCQKCLNLLVKSVRINIKFLIDLFNKLEPDKNPLKTVVLVRDPRAIINSRLNPSLGFCYGICRDPGIVCQQIRSNLKLLIELKGNSSNLLDHLTIVRYEDIALNTKSVAKKLYKRLGLSYTKKVEEWIQMKTKQKRNNLKTPLRNTTENVVNWITTFQKWKMDLNSVQNQCSDIMEMLGYKKITLKEIKQTQVIVPSHLISDSFSFKSLFIKNFI